MDNEIILEQIDTLFERFNIDIVKIGIVENWQVLITLLEKLKTLNPDIKIILDPILKASAGYAIHVKVDSDTIDSVLEKIYLVTPNYDEIQNLYPEKSIEATIDHIRCKTNLYLKGGHRLENVGLDQLFIGTASHLNIEPGISNVSPKHGSGCVLSSAIASNLALGHTIEQASILGKKYTEKFLSSTSSLLSNHIIKS